MSPNQARALVAAYKRAATALAQHDAQRPALVADVDDALAALYRETASQRAVSRLTEVPLMTVNDALRRARNQENHR